MQLGIGAIYASPVFAAVPGSNHGYNITNPLVFNKEIGSEDEFEEIFKILQPNKIGWIQDIVPNHMAFHPDNRWLMDVLEKGRLSAYSGYFDIDWEHPVFNGKLMVPNLGKSPENAVIAGEIKLIWHNGGFFISYYDFKIPINGDSFHDLLEESKALEDSYYVGQGIARDDYKTDTAFHGFGWSNSRQRLQSIYDTDNSFETLINNICEEVNSDRTKLWELLAKQYFELHYWQDVEKHLNYRRFFTINGLISLSMENPNVFEDYHAFIYEKVKAGKFQGLRIDHVDGLKKPNIYFDRLRAKMGEDTYIIVEKILEHNEQLKKDWPLQGSSGYEFLSLVNNVFTNRSAHIPLVNFYKEITGNNLNPEEVIYQNKKMILNKDFRGDWYNITRKISTSGLVNFNDKLTTENLHEALGEFLINCPVYKLYSNNLPLEPEDTEMIDEIVKKSIRKTPNLTLPLNSFKNIFLGDYSKDPEKKDLALDIFLTCMQFTGPLMAKGVEDTTMYSWTAFIAHNEVGDNIDSEGISIEKFHQRMIYRRNHYPYSLNATATHDTKRGEDTRARLNVISDVYADWIQLVKYLINNSLALKTTINGNLVPDINEEYFIYQTLVGYLPLIEETHKSLSERLANYLRKALREAKIHSNWNEPDENYENAVISFSNKLLNPEFLLNNHFTSLIRKINSWGLVNSLSQVILKCTCPGIPDFYQGTELWDFSLVDPDNRRAVDYKKRMAMLAEVENFRQVNKTGLFRELWIKKEDGRIKLWLTHKLMLERALNPEVFTLGEYLRLNVTGEFKDYILAFARVYKKIWYLTIIPLHGAILPYSKNKNSIDWKKTSIALPEDAPENWKLVWDASSLNSTSALLVADALPYDCPVVYKGELMETGRGSGVLLHITSLPGKYGSGDLGEEAYKFVDLLKKAKQSYWQILPFNPVGGSFSPYSSLSAFAGNITFIDPEELLRQRLIDHLPKVIAEENSADLIQAEKLKSSVIEQAFNNYIQQNSQVLQKKFEDFCKKEHYWLTDFALFNIFKKEFDYTSWNNWPDKIKFRDKETLNFYQEKYASDITLIKFGQYLFSEQFKKLKSYTNSKGIRIIGDMPIYVSYDSSDVWANPQFFNLDPEMKMKTVAGVPPDYFSETGQLWNMPIYDWQKLEDDGYTWWKNRIRKNLEYCDMLRFDHFRGFSSYWEVPANEKTAVNGKWTKGPAHKFFSELKREFPEMPFIAEDLGDIDEDVYKLRDDFSLPGMTVLQFAFGNNMPSSVHIPHMHTNNSIVYTGTHDNNTIKGWFKTEVNKTNKNQITGYLNKKIMPSNISEEFIRLAYSSVARVVIIPGQDILNLDETARLNNPSFPEGNWTWKLKSNDLKSDDILKLKRLTKLYGR